MQLICPSATIQQLEVLPSNNYVTKLFEKSDRLTGAFFSWSSRPSRFYLCLAPNDLCAVIVVLRIEINLWEERFWFKLDGHRRSFVRLSFVERCTCQIPIRQRFFQCNAYSLKFLYPSEWTIVEFTEPPAIESKWEIFDLYPLQLQWYFHRMVLSHKLRDFFFSISLVRYSVSPTDILTPDELEYTSNDHRSFPRTVSSPIML